MKRTALYLVFCLMAGLSGLAQGAAGPTLRPGSDALPDLNRLQHIVQRDLDLRLEALMEPRLLEAERRFGVDHAAPAYRRHAFVGPVSTSRT